MQSVKPDAAQRAKLRAGLRVRLGRPTPAEAGRRPEPDYQPSPMKKLVKEVVGTVSRVKEQVRSAGVKISEGARKVKKSTR